MIVLLLDFSLFMISFLTHIIIWRLFSPSNHRRALLIIFLGFLILGLIVLNSADISREFLNFEPPLLLIDIFHFVLLYIGLTLAYIVTYSGLEVDSPSLVITNIISKNVEEGISSEKLYEALTDDMLVKARVDDLVIENMAILLDGKYFTTRKGENMARLFNFYRKLLNVSNSGG